MRRKYRKEKSPRFDIIFCWQDCGETRLSHLAGESAKQCLWRRICPCLAKITVVQYSSNSTSKFTTLAKDEVTCVTNIKRLEMTSDVHQKRRG